MKTWELRMTAGGTAAAVALCCAPVTWATPITYQPVNPSFGGNPLNGAWLMNSANAQNGHKAPVDANAAGGFRMPTALETFNQRLQSMILDRLATSITGNVFNSTTGTLRPGTVTTSNFSISIIDIGGGMLRITTTDRTTGASATFDVSSTP